MTGTVPVHPAGVGFASFSEYLEGPLTSKALSGHCYPEYRGRRQHPVTNRAL